MAQTDGAPRPMAARPSDVTGQIKQDLSALTDATLQRDGVFGAFPYIYGARVGYFGASEWANGLRPLVNYYKIQIESVSVLERNGNAARAMVNYKIVPSGNFSAEIRKFWSGTHQETVNLKLEVNPLQRKVSVWKIVPPQVAPPVMTTSASIADQNVLLANIAYHLAQKQLPEPIGTLGERSTINLKQLGIGVLIFTQDYDEVYAFNSRYIIEALSPYITSPVLFQVPDTNEIYTFNGNLSGLNIHQVPSSEKTVLFYEGQNETPIFRYDGKAAICFADGHVALVTPEEAKNLIWKP